MKVSNLMGQVLIQKQLVSEETQISSSELPKGTYIVTVNDRENKRTKLILK